MAAVMTSMSVNVLSPAVSSTQRSWVRLHQCTQLVSSLSEISARNDQRHATTSVAAAAPNSSAKPMTMAKPDHTPKYSLGRLAGCPISATNAG